MNVEMYDSLDFGLYCLNRQTCSGNLRLDRNTGGIAIVGKSVDCERNQAFPINKLNLGQSAYRHRQKYLPY